MTQHQAIREIHERVRQCFTRHKFAEYGDALKWWHEVSYDTQKLEAGEQGMSKFSADILWLISIFGPTELVNYKIMATRKIPALKPVTVHDQDDQDEEIIPEIPRPKRKTSRRRRF